MSRNPRNYANASVHQARADAAPEIGYDLPSTARGFEPPPSFKSIPEIADAKRETSFSAYTGGSNGPLGQLPREAEEILESIATVKGDRNILAMSAHDKLQAVRQERAWAHNRFLELTDYAAALRAGKGATQVLSDDDPLVLQAKAVVDRLDARLAKLQKRHDELSDAWQQISAVYERCERYCARTANAERSVVPAPKAKAGETVARLRERIETLRVELNGVRLAPLPSSFAKEKARAEIAALAERGHPSVLAMVDHGEGIRWPMQSIVSEIQRTAYVRNAEMTEITGTAKAQVPDAVALLACLFHDQLVEAVDREIDAVADDGAALSNEDRGKREQELLAEILAAERTECGLVAAAERFDYRTDADPRAVLGISGPAVGE